MRHITFGDSRSSYNVALLVKDSALISEQVKNHYIKQYSVIDGSKPEEVIAFSLEWGSKAPSSSAMGDYIDRLTKVLLKLKVTTLVITNAAYFKRWTGATALQSKNHVVPSLCGNFSCIPIPDYNQSFYDDRIPPVITEGINTLHQHLTGTWIAPGTHMVKHAGFPKTLEDIKSALLALHQHPTLAVDIEAYSLRFDKAGIGTIAFAWNEREGIAFPVDAIEYDDQSGKEKNWQSHNESVRWLLKEFFDTYKGTLLWSNGYGYDIKILIYELYMKHMLDIEGIYEGLDVFYFNRTYHDSQVITYLATNTTAGNAVGLKDNTAEHSGNYAEDVTNIKLLNMHNLLLYNVKDAMNTVYLVRKNFPIMVQDNQLYVYEEVMLPSMPVITQTELIGMPMDMDTINQQQASMEKVRQDALSSLFGIPEMVEFRDLLVQKALDKDFETRKNKAKNPDKIKPKTKDRFDDLKFNPNSHKQVGQLLHDYFGLPILDRTKSKQPSTSADSLEKLRGLLMSTYNLTEEDIK